ncbi:MAG TPA: hypothetical protein VGS11_12055 [Candidatus Bathyarchaeia archaeon]|nr:hypothetical protein [Candidatus Bathyarchaeia archaeon]
MEKGVGCWAQWSSNERVAAVILVSVLATSIILLGLVLYEPPTGPGLCGAFEASPCPGREALNVTSATVNSPTNMSIQIVNTGSVAIFLTSYYVRNPYSQPYANSNWSSPTAPPGRVITTNLVIDGNAFTFSSGTYYTITLISSRNTQFTFSIQAS